MHSQVQSAISLGEDTTPLAAPQRPNPNYSRARIKASKVSAAEFARIRANPKRRPDFCQSQLRTQAWFQNRHLWVTTTRVCVFEASTDIGWMRQEMNLTLLRIFVIAVRGQADAQTAVGANAVFGSGSHEREERVRR